MFEKSATVCKVKRKLLNCKCTIQIVTLKLRTSNRMSHLPELTASTKDHNIDILCIQEQSYIHKEDIKYHDTGNRWTFVLAYAWKSTVFTGIGGVGMLIGPCALKSLNNRENTTEFDGSYV